MMKRKDDSLGELSSSSAARAPPRRGSVFVKDAAAAALGWQRVVKGNCEGYLRENFCRDWCRMNGCSFENGFRETCCSLWGRWVLATTTLRRGEKNLRVDGLNTALYL